MMKKTLQYLLSFILFILFSFVSKAHPPIEGMWLPLLIDELNIEQMKDLGLELNASDIYSEKNPSLKDAIVNFGGGCTGSVVSPEGLVLTNHHCGYSRIQAHSTVENDLLTDGFWAMDKSEELPNPGLFVTFVVRMEDVTQQVLSNISDTLSPEQQEKAIARNIIQLENIAVMGTHYEAKIKPFFFGNQYYLFVTETFKDIRLVGAPPSSIGKFGYDTDNWIWPRHTGDFALFRIYANENNEPAEYSEENVPYKPKKYLNISLNGVEEGDFTMVFGFPGVTEEYLTSWAVDYLMNEADPTRVMLRDKRLEVINRYMKSSDTVRIQYAAKQSSISNAYKKWQGRIWGLNRYDAVTKKQQLESQFRAWTSKQENQEYQDLLVKYEELYGKYTPYLLGREYFYEAGYSAEIVKYAAGFRGLVELSMNEDVDDEHIQREAERLMKGAEGYFSNYYLPIDQEILPQLLTAWAEGISPQLRPDIFTVINDKFKGNYQKYADHVFKASIFADKAKLIEFLDDYEKEDVNKLVNDPGYKLMGSMFSHYFEVIAPKNREFNEQLQELDKQYILALMEMRPEKKFYPDANSTMRISYGIVEDYKPVDGKIYHFETSLAGVIEKGKTDIEDYKVPEKLKELYVQKEYGLYGEDGVMPVAFIASNHTTGGNSGSPVLDAKGNLIGLNFDRNWEGTMSDIMYDPEQFRNISVNIKYILFIIDKYAGAENLIKEMKMVH